MLNTLKTNLILTRAALIALFAGLFILAACGGGGGAAAPTPAGPGTNICDANPFGETCTRDVDATARSLAITNCATNIDTDASERERDCSIVPRAVRYCLVDPLLTAGSTACDAAAYETARQGSGVTLSEVRNTRADLCRDDSNRNETLCNSTVAQNCDGDVSPFDLLCGRLNPARNAIIEKCVDSATLADSTKNADCVAASAVGFTCFDNPWAESCLTSETYREFASFRADAQEARLEYCMGDDADTEVCRTALARVCSASGDGANPFSELCTASGNAYDSVREDFATNCFNRKVTDNDVTDCTVTAFEAPRTGDDTLCGDGTPGNPGMTPNDPTCMTTPVTVATCTATPFSTTCREVDIFDDTRSVLLGLCTDGVPDDKDFSCGANGGFSADEATCLDNPFTPDVTDGINCGTLFTALGTTVKTAQDNLITACTGADGATNTRCESGIAGAEVSTCLANPFDTTCDMTLGSETQATTAQNNLIALCTGTDASVAMNTICMGITVSANNVKKCIDNPFFTASGADVTCAVALGSPEAVTLARSNLIEVCTGADADGSDTRCGIPNDVSLTGCLDNPFNTGCDTALGDGAMTAQSNVLALCVGDAITTNALCDALTGDVKTCLNNPFTTSCDTTLGGETQATAAQDNLIDACTGADADGSNPRCAIMGVDALTTCLGNPFADSCDMTLGSPEQAETAQDNIIALCTTADSDNFNTNMVCTGLAAGNVKTCLDNPFTTGGTINCETELGGTDAVTRAQANLNAFCFGDSPTALICTPLLKTSQFCHPTATGGNPFHAYCDDVAGIDEDLLGERALFCAETANTSDARCTTHTTCNANPFGSDCFADDSIYADNRERAIAACKDVPAGMRANDAACTGVEVKAEVVGGDNAAPAVTLATCFANPYLADCADDAFDATRADARFECGAGDQDSCDIVVGQDSAGMDVTVAMCNTGPLNSACADKVFDIRRSTRVAACLNALPSARDATTECDDEVKAMVAAANGNEAIAAVTVEDCIDDPFNANCTNAAFDNARTESSVACNNNAQHAACGQVIVAEIPAVTDVSELVPAVTVATCIGNPFASGCDTLDAFSDRRGVVQNECDLANVKTIPSCLLPVGDTTVNGCSNDPFHADCVSFDVFAGDRCTARPFATDCAAETYDTARDNACTSPTASNYNVFNVNCTETAYTGTDAARKTFADACRAGTATRGCDVAVSGAMDAPTIAACNTNPYATGCDDTIFADALTAYCADGAPTIFNTNCDSRENIDTARSVSIGVCVAALTTDKTDASCTGREIVAGEEEVPAIIEGTTMVDHDNDPDTPDIVARAQDAADAIPAVPAVTVGVCLDDPFNTGCASPLFQFARDDHMEVCMSNGNANLSSCANLSTKDPNYQTCLRNPFHANCTGGSTEHRYKNARAARYAFCEGDLAGSAASVATGDTDLCGSQGAGETGTTIRGEICSYAGEDTAHARLNPFAGVCADNIYVSSKRYYCGVGGRRSTVGSCSDTPTNSNSINTADGCLANPFSATCTADLPSSGATITAELRTFLTTQRTAYCTAVDVEGFDETLCQTSGTPALDTDEDFASTVCSATGALANPFANFCVREGNEFADTRETFVQACDSAVKADSSATALANGAICTPAVIACNADAYSAGCVDEAAYASVRQTVVNDCAAAFTTNAGTAAANADCVTIAGVGQLTCITENPYLNRAAAPAVAAVPGESAGTDAVIGLNCLGNSNYDMVRTTLESDCAGGGSDSAVGADRCPVLVAGVCGNDTTGGNDAAVAGSNPFDSRYCTTGATYAAHRLAVVESCVGVTEAAGSCTADIIACIANPFAENRITSGTTTANCDDASVSAAFVDRTITYCGTGSTDNAGTVTANISQEKCQMFADASGNECVQNPFGSTCTNAMLGGDDDNDELTAARTLRTTYCSGLGTTSAAIRADTSGNTPSATICLGAVENFCTGDNLFASASGADVFDCLTDAEYNTPRDTQYQLCNGDMASRANMDCDSTAVAICTNATITEADPFAPICTETDTLNAGMVTSARLAVVTECAPLNTGDRDANPRCKRTGAELVYTTCNPTDGDPRLVACDDYAAETGEPFNIARLARYATGCAGDEALINGAQEALCPADAVRTAICTDAGANARPFAPICTQTTDVAGIRDVRGRTLDNCLNDRSITTGPCATADGRAGASITAADSACLGATSSDNPFNAAVTTVPGFTTFNCNSYAAFNPSRNTYATECRKGTAGFTCAGVEGALNLICKASTGSAANPFDTTLCTTADDAAKLAFADLCDGATVDVAISGTNAATCPQTVIDCALNPFASGCTADAAYNGRKTVVLDLCQAALTTTKVGTPGTNTRCVTAISQVPCLKDPINCTGTPADFAQATVGAATYLTTVRNNRVAYCVQGKNLNTQTDICRTAATSGIYAFCMQNPFANGCETQLNNNVTGVRTTRLSYCRGLNATDIAAGSQINDFTVSRSDDRGVLNLCFVNDGFHADAVAEICYGEAGADADKSRDPFTDVCRAFPAYDARRVQRLVACAGADNISTTTTTVNSVTTGTSGVLSCNWTQQAALCGNDTADTTSNRLDAQCGTLNVPSKWATATTTTITFTNSRGDANAFVDNFDNAGTAVTFTEPTLELHPSLPGGRSGDRISDTNLPNVRFYSARTKQVLVAQADVDAGTMINVAGTMKVPVASDIGMEKTPAGTARFFAGIEVNSGNVGRPFFNRGAADPTAVWNGNIDWVGIGNARNVTGVRAFKMLVNFNARTLQGAVPITAGTTTSDHLVIDAKYSAAGIISGTNGGGVSLRRYSDNPNTGSTVNLLVTGGDSAFAPGKVSGIIGSQGAVGAFIGDATGTSGYGGGFIVKP